MLTKIMNNARMSQQQMHQQPHQMHQQSNRRQGQMMQSGHYSGHSSNRSPLPPEVQSLIANTPLNHDLLQRAEAQAIIRGMDFVCLWPFVYLNFFHCSCECHTYRAHARRNYNSASCSATAKPCYYAAPSRAFVEHPENPLAERQW